MVARYCVADLNTGSVAEWSNAPLSKSGMLARASGVRILSLPPMKNPEYFGVADFGSGRQCSE